MKILIVSRYKKEHIDNILPFVKEQGEAIRALGHNVEYFLVKGNYITAVRELKTKIREFSPDVVHAHYGLSAITAELQSLVPVVTTFHNGETLNWYVNLVVSLMSLRAKHVIYVAQHIRDLSFFKAKNYSIIPCGVPIEQMIITPKEEARKTLGWDADKKYILFGGAFSNTRKNYSLLRSAIELLEENKNIDKHCCAEINNENILEVTKNTESSAYSASSVIVNLSANEQDSLYTNCQSLSTDANEMHLIDSSEKKIIFDNLQKSVSLSKKEWIPVDGGEMYGDIVCIEMKGLTRSQCVLRMCACDLFALPSHSEGSPQALKEAMAVNCPCMATDIADVRELFGSEPGHWILRNPRKTHERWDGDQRSLDEMVELLKEAMVFEGRTKGRERIEELQLTNEAVAKRIIKVYNEILWGQFN